MKQFDEWNKVKKTTNKEDYKVGFKQRDIFYMKMGQNIGFEQDGKGNEFVRPVVIIKGFNRDMFFAVPLSTKIKDGRFYYNFEFTKYEKKVENSALLSQLRLFSSKRLLNKIGTINNEDFIKLKDKLKKLID